MRVESHTYSWFIFYTTIGVVSNGTSLLNILVYLLVALFFSQSKVTFVI